jgi:formamidopyrimidine-DNA glycosylase
MRSGFLTLAEFKSIENCHLHDVERKGKLLRMILKQCSRCTDSTKKHNVRTDESNKDLEEKSQINEYYLYLHMGMTGIISSPDNIPSLESQSKKSYPPDHTHLIIKVSDQLQVAFSDPRRFGGIGLGHDSSLGRQWREIALDAMDPDLSLDGLVGKTKGIKSLLLDQKAVLSGVGNWIADEVLYQSKFHPNQTMLTFDEVSQLKDRLKHILKIGNGCLEKRHAFPNEWIFHHRWNKGKNAALKDTEGRKITFVKSGGRSSAIVPSVQKVQQRGGDGSAYKETKRESRKSAALPSKNSKKRIRNT